MAEPPHFESTRLYLDHAATSWPKLAKATAAAVEFIEHCGSASGRGTYGSARIADSWVRDARLSLARLIGAASSECIAFCNSGTHALNAAIFGLLRSGDHVVTTAMEHNSVLRPLTRLVSEGRISLTVVPCDAHGQASILEIERSIQPNTRWLVAGHASNVTGAVQNLGGLGAIAEKRGIGFIVDASQTLGYIPINVDESAIDVLAAAGHKGLRAWAGTGMLYVAKNYHAQVLPLMTGGTGIASEVIDGMPAWPYSVEVGNLNLPGIVSMAVAAREADTSQHWRPLYQKLVLGLRNIPGMEVWSSTSLETAIPVVSIKLDGWDNHDLANVLDSDFGIEVRAGLHCAGLVHKFTQTESSGGTLRLSLGHTSNEADVERALTALNTIASSSGASQ